jgi:hypothetical protein
MATNKERIIREFVRKEILNVLKESGPSKQFKKAAEELYDAELKQQKLKDKFLKSKSAAEKQMLKQELIAQHKLVQIAQQKFSNMLMVEPADDLDESLIREGVVSLKGAKILAHKVLNKLVDLDVIPARKKSLELLNTIADVISNARMESVETSTKKKGLTELELNTQTTNTTDTESPEEKVFDKEFLSASNAIAGAIEKELKKRNTNEINEAVITSVIAAIMTSNAVIGFISKYSAKLFKLLKLDKAEDVAEKIHHWAHDNEKAFQTPIKRILKFFLKDETTIELLTKAIYALVVGGMAGQYGVAAVNKLSQSEWFSSAISALKTVAKAEESIVTAYPVVKALKAV